MSLADAAASGPTTAKLLPGKIDTWLESLEPGERDAALAILDDPQWNSMAVRRLFAEHGLKVAYTTILLYREARDVARG